jgi:hypothetical protein
LSAVEERAPIVAFTPLLAPARSHSIGSMVADPSTTLGMTWGAGQGWGVGWAKNERAQNEKY